MRKRSVIRSLVAGALIGVTEAAPLAAVRRPSPLRVVWIDDRDLPDPLDDLPIMLLDPVPLQTPVQERPGPLAALRLSLTQPYRMLRSLRHQLRPD